MKVKVFEKNESGKIEFTRKELEALLNEVFNDGFKEGRDSKTYTWTSPSITYPNWTYLNTNSKPYETDYGTTVTCATTTATSDTTNLLNIYYGS